jgi:hypothetical protein
MGRKILFIMTDQQPDALSLFRGTGYVEIADYDDNEFASYWFEKQL